MRRLGTVIAAKKYANNYKKWLSTCLPCCCNHVSSTISDESEFVFVEETHGRSSSSASSSQACPWLRLMLSTFTKRFLRWLLAVNKFFKYRKTQEKTNNKEETMKNPKQRGKASRETTLHNAKHSQKLRKTRKTTTETKLYWMRIRTQVKCEPICCKCYRRGRRGGRMGRWLNLFAAINEISTRHRNLKRIPGLVGSGRNEFARNNVVTISAVSLNSNLKQFYFDSGKTNMQS